VGRWQEIDHTADLALRIWGDSLTDLFAQAARGMFDLAVTCDATGVKVERHLALEAPDVEALLVDWLNELLYLSEIDNVAYLAFEFVACTSTQLRARLFGLPILERRRAIKAATYHNLEVVAREAGLETEVVFDV
jgi:SHS2 domain-containing protein